MQPRSGSEGYDEVFSFLAGNRETSNMSRSESDLLSWMLMNGLDVVPLPEETPSYPAVRSESPATSDPSPHVEDNSTVSLKRQRRLERNREIAKNCRERKKQKFQVFSKEHDELTKLNQELKCLLQLQREKHTREREHRVRLEQLKSLSGTDKESEMRSELQKLYHMWTGASRDRSANLDDALLKLNRMLLPSHFTKLTLWSLNQEVPASSAASALSTPPPSSSFLSSSASLSPASASSSGSISPPSLSSGAGSLAPENETESMWSMICSAIGITDQQQQEIMKCRESVRLQRQNLSDIKTIMEQIRKNVSENMAIMESQMKTIMDILTPEQQLKFLFWFETQFSKK